MPSWVPKVPRKRNRGGNIMRNFVLAAAAVFTLSLVACGDKDEDTGDTASEEAVEDTSAEEASDE